MMKFTKLLSLAQQSFSTMFAGAPKEQVIDGVPFGTLIEDLQSLVLPARIAGNRDSEVSAQTRAGLMGFESASILNPSHEQTIDILRSLNSEISSVWFSFKLQGDRLIDAEYVPKYQGGPKQSYLRIHTVTDLNEEPLSGFTQDIVKAMRGSWDGTLYNRTSDISTIVNLRLVDRKKEAADLVRLLQNPLASIADFSVTKINLGTVKATALSRANLLKKGVVSEYPNEWNFHLRVDANKAA